MPAEDIRLSNDELMLMISALQLAAAIVPEVAVGAKGSKLLSERMSALNKLTHRLTRIAFRRGLRPIQIASTNILRITQF